MTARTQSCSCGKRGWRSKRAADLVVVEAKIRRTLHGSDRRREQRSYRCPFDAGVWHVTSTPERTEPRDTPGEAS